MYKKDKQGMLLLLIALSVLLVVAIVMQWQSTVFAAAIGLTLMLVQSISNIHQRLLHLEQAAANPLMQSAGIGVQKALIYGATLLALWGYANTWLWLVAGAVLVLLFCIIQLMSTFQNRLVMLEQIQQVAAEPPIPAFKPTAVEQPLTSAIPVSGQLTITEQQDPTVPEPQQS